MKSTLDLANPPDKYWHCAVKLAGQKRYAIVNDLSFAELKRTIVTPWSSGRNFTVGGMVVSAKSGVSEIKIAHTTQPQQHYADLHNAKMRAANIGDLATDRQLLPLSRGTDATYELLFAGSVRSSPEPDVAMVEQICRRLPQAARILGSRPRKGKAPFDVADEYDVQDLLHATLRAFIKYSVQEDPLPKVAGAKSGRADISIEELGVLIEVKFVYGPEDQKRIFEEYSQDLLLYPQWAPLRTLIYLIYNAADLRDPEAFEKLGGEQEIGGRRFVVRMVLA